MVCDPIKAKANAKQIHDLIQAYKDVIAAGIPDLKIAWHNAKTYKNPDAKYPDNYEKLGPALPYAMQQKTDNYFRKDYNSDDPRAVAWLKHDIWVKITNHDHRVKHIAKLIQDAREANETTQDLSRDFRESQSAQALERS
jgi:hypothetical protein